jgi:hypothetical protein
MGMNKWIVLSALLGCTMIAHADDKVTFQYNFQKGQLIRTHLVVSSEMSMGKSTVTMDTSMHVDDTKDDGTASLTTKIDGGEVKMMGMKMPMPGRGKEYHMTVSKFGKAMEMADNKTAVTVQEFPDHPIAVGESWDGTVQVQGSRTPMQVKAHFTFDSIKNVDGHKLAHLLVVEDGGMADKGGMTIHATGWMDWNIDQGIPSAAHVEGTEEMGKMTGTFVSDQTTTIGS